MILSIKHKFIFWHIPKNAGVSMAKVLDPCKMPLERIFGIGWTSRYSGRDRNVDPLHINYEDFGREVQDRIRVKHYKEFAFVRHPYARAVSMYNYSRQPKMYRAVDSQGNLTPKPVWDTLDEYLVYLSQQPASAWNKKCQTHWTNSTLTTNGVAVFRVEDLPDAWSGVQNYLAIELPDLPVLNDSEKRMSVDQLSNSQKDDIYNLYASDFEAFGYER